MINFRPSHHPVVFIAWNDAHVSTDEITKKQALKVGPELTYTVGFLIAENEEGVSLVSDTYKKHPNSGRVPNFITWEMIVSYEYLTE